MIDINQVQRDFDNGVMLCRETIRQVIELAATKVNHQAVAEWVNDEQGFQRLHVAALPDGTQLYAIPQDTAVAVNSSECDTCQGWPGMCRFPMCKSKAEQDAIANDVYVQLYG